MGSSFQKINIPMNIACSSDCCADNISSSQSSLHDGHGRKDEYELTQIKIQEIHSPPKETSRINRRRVQNYQSISEIEKEIQDSPPGWDAD